MKKTLFAWCFSALLTSTLVSCSDENPDPLGNSQVPDPPVPGGVTVEVEIKPKAMWIDTEANFKKLAFKDGIHSELEKVKKYGYNMIYVDVKPSNGYALYKSDFLPYCNAFGPLKVTRDYDDYLQVILDKCEELELDVVASVSATGFGYNNGAVKQGLYWDQYDQWKDFVQVRSVQEDPNALMRIDEDPLQTCVALDLAFPEVQEHIVKVCEELAKKYPRLKGISLDYLRYCNNDGGWFGMGDHNMQAYAEYWGEPAPVHTDIVTATGGVGPCFAKWIELRSMTVTNTLAKIREAVKAVNPNMELHLWASSQWSSRFSVGQNWASKRYTPQGYQYTDTYHKTGFADLLDVFITGAYAAAVYIKDNPGNDWSVENFVKTWNDYIMDDCRCYGSIQVYDTKTTSEDVSAATYLCLKYTHGFMNFELSHTNNRDYWNASLNGFRRYEGVPSSK